MAGGQVGWRPVIGTSRLTLGASYFDSTACSGRNTFFTLPAGANGNTTTTVAANCLTAAPCLVSDYDDLEVFAEWTLHGIRAAAGHVRGLRQERQGRRTDLDTAYSIGAMYGKAADPHTWEIGYFYQLMEKDALLRRSTSIPTGARAIPMPRAA